MLICELCDITLKIKDCCFPPKSDSDRNVNIINIYNEEKPLCKKCYRDYNKSKKLIELLKAEIAASIEEGSY